ncbi:hypothetical protein ABFG95_13610 [Achromobacter sp. HNDS-1]|jgi:hypothetical protein|uniref:Lipoprotein n=1 Tax=Achromobacter sp. HNDS-1 TaxID=3151598 RepID=A0AAU7LHW9_9BURK|nr:hypothetical protein [Achromobacter ruhlandii]MCI1835343.1 hypothetical protein [Achromobacter ruhlandii]
MIAVLRCVASALLLGGALAGCSATNPNILSHYDAGSSARVRVYVYTADRIRLDFDRTCFLPASGLFGHGDGLETIQRSHMRGSGSVGMPPSPNISGLVFDEFIIKAGIPVTIYGQVGGTYRSAGPYGSVTTTSWPETKNAGYFTPAAGKDYEVYVERRAVVVQDITVPGASAAERQVPLTPASPCPEPPATVMPKV